LRAFVREILIVFGDTYVQTTKPVSTGNPNEPYAEKRRTQRVRIAMPVIIRGKHGNQSFEEATATVSVSAHGCMVHLDAQVGRAQHLTIVNKNTMEELLCRVSYLGQGERGRQEVGLEFAEVAPRFWKIAFPPDDWNPADRKRAGLGGAPK
jgi:PilZ domain